MTRPTVYTFVRNIGSRHGELHRERAGFVKFVALAYLTLDGSLFYGGGGWLGAGLFRVTTAAPAVKVSARLLDRVIVDSMAIARKMLGERFHAHPPAAPREPFYSADRDSRHEHSL